MAGIDQLSVIQPKSLGVFIINDEISRQFHRSSFLGEEKGGWNMAETLKTVRNLKLFNRLNKCIKQGITDLQNKDYESSTNYFNMAAKTAKNLEGIAEEPFREHFTNIVSGLNDYESSKNEDVLVSTNPTSVHSQLWAVHKKICDAFNIPYVEDVDEMEEAISKLAAEGKIS